MTLSMQTPLKGCLILAFLLVSCSLAGTSQSLAQDNADAGELERLALPFYPEKPELKAICNLIDDSQHVELYNGGFPNFSRDYVREHQVSTLQLQWVPKSEIAANGYEPGNIGGYRWCTGTLLDDRHVLTAGHCFDPKDGTGRYGWVTPWKMGPNNQPDYANPQTLAPLFKANFNYQLDENSLPRTADEFPVVALLEWREGAARLDYAILELGENSTGQLPGAKYAPAKVRIDDPNLGDAIAIIQHPDGQPKKIETGAVDVFQGSLLLYGDLDTQGGSSGSGIRDIAGTVIGVHIAGGCVALGHNRGVKNSAISEVSNLLSNWAN